MAASKNLLDGVPAPEQIKNALVAMGDQSLSETERHNARSRLRGMLAVTDRIPARAKLAQTMRYALRKLRA
jgi:hypothetical protein